MTIPNSRCKQCQLENNTGNCDRFDCANYNNSFVKKITIQNIIEKFDEVYNCSDLLLNGDNMRKFLQSSLTELLDSLEKESENKKLKVLSEGWLLNESVDFKLNDVKGSYNLALQEVINIINSHK